MTTSIDRPSPAHAADVIWAVVEDGFYVGTRAGEYLGYVDRQGDSDFLACNAYSRPVGRFPDLETATSAVMADSARVESGASYPAEGDVR